MFQIESMTEATLQSVTNRVEKHGEEEVPAVSLGIKITAANTLLDLIDPQLRHALYSAIEGQAELPGVEAATPVLRCNSFEKHTLTRTYEGWTLAVDDGADETTPMVFGSVKCDKFVIEAKQGGSIELRMRLGTSDVDADKLGKLAMHNGQSIWITLKAPENPAPVIDGTVEAFRADYPDAEDATDLFVGEHGDSSSNDDGATEEDRTTSDDGAEDSSGDGEPARGENWPFPQGGAKTDAELRDEGQVLSAEAAERASKRPERARAKTKAALAAGAQ